MVVGQMSELELAGFWRTRFTGAASQAESKLEGWKSSATSPDGFVEPKLKILEGDPHTARILIIAAPGAVGKSSYARALAAATNSVVVDLAATAPLGGHFFTGALSNAFDAAALVQVATGRIGLIVDALDEAQMRAGPKGYEAGLDDLACLTLTDKALPAVLLGRAIAAAADLHALFRAEDAQFFHLRHVGRDDRDFLRRQAPFPQFRVEAKREPRLPFVLAAFEEFIPSLRVARSRGIDKRHRRLREFGGLNVGQLMRRVAADGLVGDELSLVKLVG